MRNHEYLFAVAGYTAVTFASGALPPVLNTRAVDPRLPTLEVATEHVR